MASQFINVNLFVFRVEFGIPDIHIRLNFSLKVITIGYQPHDVAKFPTEQSIFLLGQPI